MRIAALIVAAGRGERMGASLPKQYLTLGGKTLLRHSIERFRSHGAITHIQVVIDPNHRTLYDQAIGDLQLPEPVSGGATRQDSVRSGLEILSKMAEQPDLVLIHDAARPFTSTHVIDCVIAALMETPGAIPALPLADTIKRAKSLEITETVDRRDLWRAQTPQGFRFGEIWAAHRKAQGKNLTDDAAVAEDAGLAVTLVEGEEENFKVTTESDLRRAAMMINQATQWEYRTGSGFDVHKFMPGDHIMLCGIQVIHDQALEGHSDADVGLHAITDALLGAVGAGDIGQHFPPTDPQWKGADSVQFLTYAAKIARERGAQIRFVDVTIICERPKVGPYRERMAKRIAELLDITADRVSIKATTTEGLGFTGRREGIAAQATVTIALPLSA